MGAFLANNLVIQVSVTRFQSRHGAHGKDWQKGRTIALSLSGEFSLG